MMNEDEDLNPKNRGLGRGLNALFGDEEEFVAGEEMPPGAPGSSVASSNSTQNSAPIESLHSGSLQPRQHFDEEALAELTESITAHGLLQPILVRESKAQPGSFEIIAGERRWRAAQRAGLHEVPIIVRTLDDVQALEIALIENLQREDLSPIEEARGYMRLLDEYGHTQEKLAEAVGKSRSYIANTVRLLMLPQAVQKYLEEGQLTAGHARALINADNAVALAEEIIAKGLSVRDIERKAGSQKAPRTPSEKNAKDVDTLALEQEVSNALGMKVEIHTRDAKSGKLSIQFKSLDQLDEILHRLSHYPGSRLTG